VSVLLIPDGITWRGRCPACGGSVDQHVHSLRAGGAEDTTLYTTCSECGWNETQNVVETEEDDEFDEDEPYLEAIGEWK
jgi:predicted  nucleic acid-binding Zn-ribbon protein